MVAKMLLGILLGPVVLALKLLVLFLTFVMAVSSTVLGIVSAFLGLLAMLVCTVLAEWAGNACCGMAGQPIGDTAGGSMGAGWTGKAGGLGGGKGVSLRDNIKKVLSTHGAHFKRAKVLQVM